MTDAGSQDQTFTLLANKLGDRQMAIANAGFGLIGSQSRNNAIPLESTYTDSQSPGGLVDHQESGSDRRYRSRSVARNDNGDTGHRLTNHIGSISLHTQKGSCLEEG